MTRQSMRWRCCRRSIIPQLKAHIHTHIRTYTHTHTHTHTHIYTHTYAHLHTHIRTYTHTHTHIYTHTYAHIHTHIHTHIRTYTHTHTHIYTHTYTHTQQRQMQVYSDSSRNEGRKERKDRYQLTCQSFFLPHFIASFSTDGSSVPMNISGFL
jgi:hypothetical protein